MFTGIIEQKATIQALDKTPDLTTLTLKTRKRLAGLRPGDSIAVDGVCLTVRSFKASLVTFEVMRETLRVSTLGLKDIGDSVNVERALPVNGRVDGHFVSGHVDEMGTIREVITDGDYHEIQIAVSARIRSFLVAKGSITVDGVSLTVGRVWKTMFAIYLIPHTLEETTLGERQKGDRVNLEADLLAKYAHSFLERTQSGR